jgi:hypothetical protein
MNFGVLDLGTKKPKGYLKPQVMEPRIKTDLILKF